MLSYRPLCSWSLPAFLVAVSLGACSDLSVEGGGPLELDVSVDSTVVATGQRVRFDYAAVGTYLSGIVLQYGDGTADTVYAYGSQNSSGSLVHEWSVAGEYVVQGTAYDGSQGTASSAPITMQVNDAGG